MRSSDPTILAFDTSAAHCAAALIKGPKHHPELFWKKEEMARGQAERLMPMLEEILQEAAITFSDLDAIAVGVGPGNFTGIRISVSAARGLSLALGIPAVGINLFEVRSDGAFRLLKNTDDVLVCLPGPRDGLYVQLRSRSGEILEPRFLPKGEEVLNDRELAATAIGPKAGRLEGKVTVDGRWNSSRRSLFRSIAIARDRLASGDRIPRPAPLYIRPADAAPSSDPPPVILP